MNAVTLIAEVILFSFLLSLLLLPPPPPPPPLPLLFLLLPLPLPKNAASACGEPTSAVSDSCVVVPRSVEISAVRARGAREGPGGGQEGDEASEAAPPPTMTGRAVAHASRSVLIPPPPPAPPLPLPVAPPFPARQEDENLLHGGSSLARTPRVTKAP